MYLLAKRKRVKKKRVWYNCLPKYKYGVLPVKEPFQMHVSVSFVSVCIKRIQQDNFE